MTRASFHTPCLLWVMSALFACGESPRRALGSPCEVDSQCAEGMCLAETCLAPGDDDDGDGLGNRVESGLGTNPLAADSDGDGVRDDEEVGVDLANPRDDDDDGRIDAIERLDADADSDCIADQIDAFDREQMTDPRVLAALVCKDLGACGAEAAAVTASCVTGKPRCNYAAVPGYEVDEETCDGVDNDCDGATDERFAATGDIRFDGGAYLSDAGKALGATCGIGACAGGTVVCAPSGAGLACSTGGRSGRLACDSDMDCDGSDDEAQVDNPITDPLAGCSDFYPDADDDGYGAGAPRCLCGPFGDYRVTTRDDCAELDPQRYPHAPGVCGADADCDGAPLDQGEPCDDGDDDVADGCHACQPVAKRVNIPGVAPAAIGAVGTSRGGFVVAWDNGYIGDTHIRVGRSLAFYDAAGREVARIDGLSKEDPNEAVPVDLVALPDGVVAVGAWRLDPADQRWVYEVQRYDEDGSADGEPIAVYRGAWASEERALVAVGGGRMALALAEYPPSGQGRLRVKLIDEIGRVAAGEGGRDLLAGGGALEVLGMDDGGFVAAWSETGGTPDSADPAEPAEYRIFFTQLFDKSGHPLDEARPMTTGDTELRSVRLARNGVRWAVFFLAMRDVGDAIVQPLGYQVFAGSAPVFPVTYLEETDHDGCPDAFRAGFDSAGNPWAVMTDDACGTLMRGWYAGATTVSLRPLDEALHPGATSDLLAGDGDGVGFVLAFRVTGGAAPGLYLSRFGEGATPRYLPTE